MSRPLFVLVLAVGCFASSSSLASPTQWPDVSGPVQNVRLGGNDVALVAGVGRPFVLPPIPGASEVATDWYRFLVEGRGIPVEQAVLLRDGDVTRETLLAEATRLRKSLKPGGTFWIVFVGHGAPSLNGKDGLLLGVDVQPTIRSIEDRGLSQQALLQAAGASHVVAIIDACFSGVRSDGSGEALVPGAQATLPLRRVAPAPPSVTILQASDTVAGPLPGHDRPAFSYLLLGAARGWADDDGDGVVRIKDAFVFAKKALAVTVRDRTQVPSLFGAGDLVLNTKARERGPSLREAVTAVRPATARATDDNDTFDRVAAEGAFKKRRVVATGDGFVRGIYATEVDEGSIIKQGEPFAPEAASVVRDITGRTAIATTAGVGVGVAGVVVGALGGAGIALASGGDQTLGVPLALVGALLGTIPGLILGVVLSPSDADRSRLSSARSDVAEAINVADRRELGLE